MSYTRTAATLAALTAVTALLAGCSSVSTTGTATPVITTVPSASALSKDGSTCSAASLTPTLGQGPDVAAAGTGTSITLTNHTSTPCTISGYVTLSYISGPTGPAVGSAARHDDSGTFAAQPVRVTPGGSAVVIFSSVKNQDPTCQAQPLWGYRVILPGQDDPIIINLLGTQTEKSDPSATLCPDSYMVLAPIQDPAHL